MRAPSIMQTEKECYISGSKQMLDLHHVYPGAYRNASDRTGCWVWLRHDIHMDLHQRNTELLKRIQRETQEEFEKRFGHDEFMRIFGKSFL